MSETQINETLARLRDAITREDEKSAADATIALAGAAIGSLIRIAAALERLGPRWHG
jgi:hypothetical protein